jgi:hypothetical protein
MIVLHHLNGASPPLPGTTGKAVTNSLLGTIVDFADANKRYFCIVALQKAHAS